MNKSVDEQIGAKVGELREQASMSIDTVAQACGLTSKEYTDSEAGVRRFSIPELFELCNVFGVSLSDIFGDRPSR